MMALLSDVHGNLPALRAALRAAKELGCDRFLSLGDVVGYGAQPGECIDLLEDHCATNVLGNHDLYLLTGTPCTRSRVVTKILSYQRTVVTERQLAWLAGSVPAVKDGSDYFVHGGPRDPVDEYLYVISPKTIPDGVQRLFSGHTHVQALVSVAERVYCNPGSVGQPRDGDPRAAFAVVTGDAIHLQRTAYDVDAAIVAMKRAGFEPYCYENLRLGAQIGGRIDSVRVAPD